MKRDIIIRVRVNTRERDDIDAAAKRTGETRAAYVRRCALDAAVPVVVAEPVVLERGSDNSFRSTDQDHNGNNGGRARRPRWFRRIPLLSRG